MRLESWISLKYLTASSRHHISFITIISILGVLIAVSSVVVVLGVMSGFSSELRSKLLSINYQIEVFTDKMPSDDLVRKIESVDPLVESATVFSRRIAGVKKDEYNYLGIRAEGLKLDQPQAKYIQKYLVDQTTDNNQGVFIGSNLADELDLSSGDELSIYIINPDNKKQIKEYLFPIKGIFKVGMYDIDSSVVIIPISISRDLFSDQNVYRGIGLRLKDISKVNSIKKKIIANPDEEIISVKTWLEYNKTLFSAIELEKITMFVILSIIILVAVFNIFSTLTVKVVEKTKDIGVLKTLGVQPGGISLIFTIQGVFIGFVGIVLGILLGIGLLTFIKDYPLIKIPVSVYGLEYLPAEVNFHDITMVGIVAFVLCVIFSIFPALSAAGINEAEALRYE